MSADTNTNRRTTFARFPLGETYITPGAEEALMIAGQTGIEFLGRHMCGDFGELTDEDSQENELSLREGFRVLSAYRTAPDKAISSTENRRIEGLTPLAPELLA